MGKRAAAPAGAAWKRQRGIGPKSKINTIVAALQDSNLISEAPEVARAMLAQGATNALYSFVEDRHPMQETISGYIKEILDDMSGRLKAQVEEVKKASSTAEAELELHTAQLQVAKDELEEAKAAIEKKGTALDEAKKALQECEVAIATLAAVQGHVTKEKDALEKEQAKYRDIDETMLKVLLEQGPAAGGSEKEAKKSCDKLMREFVKLGAEPALLAAAPPVLFKTPEARQGFDSHVLDSLKAILAERHGDVAKRLGENAAATEAKAPEVAAKKEAGENARAAVEAAKGELDAAEEAASEKEVNLAKAQSLLEATQISVEAKGGDITSALEEVEAFEEVLACYNFLAVRSKEPAPEETAAPEAKAPEADASVPAAAA
eukprot:TRINITY_DN83476_c0_g1_i1.p1 TRINITY_DN83476_c0_g1~~TRINITY_DN83476_c0_g1_i1.p1  ORF type:complete len:378 (-),score=144.98 TRINITY_DN83476_c0_g1_i1:150-1283(-)